MRIPAITLLLLQTLPTLCAAESSFTGSWYIDLRTPDEVAAKEECGGAGFELIQKGKAISGTHYFATVKCGRLNEGGAVKGIATGSEATLLVTSGRNGAVVRGKATLQRNRLTWQTLEEIKPGEPDGDSPLILGKGVLIRQEPEPQPNNSFKADTKPLRGSVRP
jgi:hypothetical protein